MRSRILYSVHAEASESSRRCASWFEPSIWGADWVQGERGPAASSAGDSAGDVRSLGSLLGVVVVVSVIVVGGGG